MALEYFGGGGLSFLGYLGPRSETDACTTITHDFPFCLLLVCRRVVCGKKKLPREEFNTLIPSFIAYGVQWKISGFRG